MIDRRQQRAAVIECSHAIETDGVQSLEDVTIFAVHRQAALTRNEPLNFLESRNDALLPRRVTADTFLRRINAKLRE